MRWRILGKIKAKAQEQRQKEIVKILFKNRGLVSAKQKEDFLNPVSPFDYSLKELGISLRETRKAISRIIEAIGRKEKIIVYGDYDADGICGTAIVWESLNRMGAKVMPYIPDRINEGYGLNKETIKRLKDESPDLKLIITVDQGITAGEKVKFAQGLGIEIIITDHHVLPRVLPPAMAVFHTTSLCGAALAWVLVRELAKAKNFSLISKERLISLLELATIGTITDLLPLIGPSRSIVFFGLKKLNQTERLGFKALFKEAGVEEGKIGPYEVGFIIGPRLNSAGRIENALDALRLICTNDFKRASDLACSLGKTNRRRQEIMEETASGARKIWMEKRKDGAKIIVLDHPDWEEGVIGLAASRLVEEFYLPVVVISKGEKHSKGSARSVHGFNIIEAIREAQNLLVDVGGHPMAAGFTVETKNLDKVKEKLVEIAEQRVDSRILEKTLRVDCEVGLDDLNWSLYRKIADFSPFGVGNPQPDFVSREIEVKEARLVGRDNKHLKMAVRSPETKRTFNTIGFGMGEIYPQLSPEKKIDLAFNLMVNEWDGRKSLELRVKDIRV